LWFISFGKEMRVGMKRAFIIVFMAVLTAMLVLPATTPSAKSLGTSASPTVNSKPINPAGPYVPPIGPNRSGDGDEGDGDDLAGIRDLTPGSAFTYGAGSVGSVGARVWWMYFLMQVVRL
jgi:hypothetical protein